MEALSPRRDQFHWRQCQFRCYVDRQYGAQFQVVVTNPAGSVTSAAATLTVVPAPAVGAISSQVLALGPVVYWPLNETIDPSDGGVGAYDAAGLHDGTYLTVAQNAFNGVTGVQPADGYSNLPQIKGPCAAPPTPIKAGPQLRH
jgi:hypothetical protein